MFTDTVGIGVFNYAFFSNYRRDKSGLSYIKSRIVNLDALWCNYFIAETDHFLCRPFFDGDLAAVFYA